MINIRQKIYSRAFEDGVNYAISKMFNEESDDDDLVSSTAAGAGLAGGLGGGFAWSRKNAGNIIAGKHLIKGIQEDTEKQKGRLKEAEEEINKREKNLKNAEIINGEKGSNPNKTRLESARVNLEEAKGEYGRIEDRIKENQESIKKSKSSIRNNRLKKFLKIGGGAAVGVGAGLGAAALYKRIKNKKENKGE
jgi:hypothetical protein